MSQRSLDAASKAESEHRSKRAKKLQEEKVVNGKGMYVSVHTSKLHEAKVLNPQAGNVRLCTCSQDDTVCSARWPRSLTERSTHVEVHGM